MVYRPRALDQPEQLATAVAGIQKELAPDVVRLRYHVEPDWYGDPAIFFKILLTDEASRPDRRREVAPRTVFFIEKELDSFNSWPQKERAARQEHQVNKRKPPKLWTLSMALRALSGDSSLSSPDISPLFKQTNLHANARPSEWRGFELGIAANDQAATR